MLFSGVACQQKVASYLRVGSSGGNKGRMQHRLDGDILIFS